jgi:hypothetical protein
MTKSIYEVIEHPLGDSILKRIDADGKEWFIPMDEANSDYQRYLNPEAEQSTLLINAVGIDKVE